MRRLSSTALILLAGVISFFASASGDAGPMAGFGRSDANIAAVDAWQQIPLHAALAVGVAFAGPSRLRRVVAVPTGVVMYLMSLWAAYLTMSVIVGLGDYTDLPDVAVAAALLSLYAAGTILALRSFR